MCVTAQNLNVLGFCGERGSERACPVCAPAEGRINNSPVAGRLQCLVMIIGARGVNGGPGESLPWPR